MDTNIIEWLDQQPWYPLLLFILIFGGAGIYFYKFFKRKFDKRKHILNNYGNDVQKYIDILTNNPELMKERKICEMVDLLNFTFPQFPH